MDLSLLFLLGDPLPVGGGPQHLLLAGGWLPTIVPIAACDEAQLRAWRIDDPQAAFADRLASALRIDEERAWQLLDARTGGALDHDSELVIAHWIASRKAVLGIPAEAERFALIGATRADERSYMLAWNARMPLFATFARPAWHGPVLISSEATASWHTRPLMPRIHLPAHNSDPARRRACAQALVQLQLARRRPPTAGWPVWLRTGLIAYARDLATGTHISPRRQWRQRRAAGILALRAVLQDRPRADAAPLALAICSVLLHSRHRQHLPALFDALRNDLSAEAALRLSYGIDCADLIARP